MWPPAAEETLHQPGDGVMNPRLIDKVEPGYSEKASKAKIDLITPKSQPSLGGEYLSIECPIQLAQDTA